MQCWLACMCARLHPVPSTYQYTVQIVIQPPSAFNVPGCGTLLVSCSAAGPPLDSFTFSHAGATLSEATPGVNITVTEEAAGSLTITTATLTLCSVTLENMGDYICTATAGASSSSSMFTINVGSQPGTYVNKYSPAVPVHIESVREV